MDGIGDFTGVGQKIMMYKCHCCRNVLFGQHFSCRLCLGNSPNTFDLCCSCYGKGGYLSHEHSYDQMLDMAFIRSSCAEQKSHRKKEMEELHKIAKAHYHAGSPEVQALALGFYRAMDTDGDGRVSIDEFLRFMRKNGCKNLPSPQFFQELDLDGNGTLDFFELMTLYYIINSKRPCCNGCQKCILGIYFSCVECFKNPKNSFHMCRDCYESTKCSHNHKGRVQFLDNYTMLQTIRNSNRNKWKKAIGAIETGITIGAVAATLCTIM